MARANKTKLYVQDVTLRDGMHSLRHQFGLEAVRSIARALDAARVDAIEITHGDGLTGSTFNYGFGSHDDVDWIGAVAEVCTHAVPTILLIPGIGTVHDLKRAHAAGARSVRVATHCTEADVSRQHIEAARGLGMDTVGFLMMAHMASPETLVEQAKLMEAYGAECVCRSMPAAAAAAARLMPESALAMAISRAATRPSASCRACRRSSPTSMSVQMTNPFRINRSSPEDPRICFAVSWESPTSQKFIRRYDFTWGSGVGRRRRITIMPGISR